MEMPTITADWLLARCRDDGCGCLIWTGCMKGNQPRARIGPAGVAPWDVRRLIVKAMTGKEPPKTHFARLRCQTYGCVEPSHIYLQHRKDVLAGRKLPMHHRVKLAIAGRAKGLSDLTMEDVRAIKASGLSAAKEAELRGVGETTIHDIRRGVRWRDYSSPWAGL